MKDAREVIEAAEALAAAGLEGSEAWRLAEVAGEARGSLPELVRARVAGTPLAHLLGRQRFLGIELLCAPGVLVPREETEILGRAAIETLSAAAAGDREVLFVDLCCGAGNLACSIAAHVPTARGWALDLTAAAVELAARNVERLGLSQRVQVLRGDLLAPLSGLGLEGALDAIVCNPPYISAARLAGDRAPLLTHEPREAFDGGPYGLNIHQRVAREAAPYARGGAPVLFEVGEGQHRQVTMVLNRAGSWGTPELRFSAAGVPRVVMARRKAD